MILIEKRKHLVTQIARGSDVKVANKQNKVMYMSTPTFLEICICISPGTSHYKWVKTYGAKLSKFWFTYEWLDTAEKFDLPGLPPSKE